MSNLFSGLAGGGGWTLTAVTTFVATIVGIGLAVVTVLTFTQLSTPSQPGGQKELVIYGNVSNP